MRDGTEELVQYINRIGHPVVRLKGGFWYGEDRVGRMNTLEMLEAFVDTLRNKPLPEGWEWAIFAENVGALQASPVHVETGAGFLDVGNTWHTAPGVRFLGIAK